MSSVNIALNIIARNMGGGAFGAVAGSLGALAYGIGSLNAQLGATGITTGQVLGGLAGAGAAFGLFTVLTKSATTQSADLETALTQMDIAISDSSSHAPALSKAVIDIGNASTFTHTQVAEAFTALGKMGFTSEQILGGVGKAAVNLSIATGVDATTGAQLLGQAMNVYNMKASDASSASDTLTRSFYDSGVGASGLQAGLAMAGGQAKTVGLSFNDFMTTLDLMSRSMGSGSKAGTSLRYMLAGMTNPTSKAMAELNNLGIVTTNNTSPALNGLTEKLLGMTGAQAKASGAWDGTVSGLNAIYTAGQKAGKIPLDKSFMDWATQSGVLNDKLYDSKGHFLGMKNAIDQIQASLKGMSPQQIQEVMGSLFNVRGGQGAQQMVNMLGSFDTKYNQVSSDLSKQGTAQNDANKMLETANGRWQQMGTTMNSFMSQVGTPINGVLKNIYLGINNVVSFMSNNGSIKTFTTLFLVLGTVLSVVALIVGGVLLVAFAATLPIVAALLPLIIAAGAVFGAIVLVAAGLAAAILVVKYGFDQVGKAGSLIGTIFAPIKTLFTDMWNIFQSQFMPALKQLSWLWNALKVILIAVAVVAIAPLIIVVLVVMFALLTLGLVVVGVLKFINWLKDGVVYLAETIAHNFMTVIHALPGALQTVINWFKNLGSSIANVAKDAWQWGVDLVQNFINGIGSMIGNLGNALGNVAGKIKSFLHFSKPDEGPLSDADTYGGDFVQLLATGMTNKLSVLHGAVGQVASTMSTGVSSATVGTSGLPAPAGSQGTVTIPIYLDSKLVGQAVYDLEKKQLRTSGASRMFR